MRFLADESCDFGIVRALRAAGHDVAAVVEACPGAADEQVIELALRDSRVLLTEDKDFGQLVYSAARRVSGVILVRYAAFARDDLVKSLLSLAEREDINLRGCFAVVEPGRVRLTVLP